VYTVFTPKHALSGSLDFETPISSNDMRLRLHLDANYAGKQYSFQAEGAETESSFIVNGSLALNEVPLNSNGVKGTLSVWVRNLFNEDHIYRRSDANNSILGSYANFNPPRTFGLQGTVNF
jgi:iron complex outermembrane receptor protein